MRRRGILATLVLVVAASALVAAGCGGGGGGENKGGGGGGNVKALPASSCQGIEYKGEGDPDVLIASDLPMQGASRTQTVQMVKAIRYVLNQHNWKAGDTNVGYQVCDDSTAQAGKWDSGKCSQNAQAYKSNDAVVGVIGTFNSGCAAIEIPVLNQAPNGGIGMISPANTYVCLTASAPACESTEPDKYYPTGNRNYIRMVAHDAYQGAADAELAKSLGVKSVYVLNDKEAYGLGVATNFRDAAKHLGIKIAGFAAYDPKASSYEALFNKIKGTGADAVFLGGLICENGGQVIKDKVSVLGPNAANASEGVVLIAPDGFTTNATINPSEGGAKEAAGMYSSVAGLPPEQLKGTGKQFITGFTKQLGGEAIDPYAPYGAQAAEVMLNAIEQGGTDRAKIIDALFNTDVQNGILGSFQINEDGDPTAGPITVNRFNNKELETFRVITPKTPDVDAALGK